MKIIIISGFLGAGKTTFIKEMSQKTGKKFVIVENEFGELGVDGELLKKKQETNEEMNVWELTEGCICCSLNLDFTYSILTIANSLNPDYLLIEPSGVAWPSRIIQQLNKITYEHISLAPPITIIDGRHYLNSRQQFSDYFYDQLAVAGMVVTSKSETFQIEDFNHLKNDLKLNPNVEFPTTHYSYWTKEQWLDLLNKEMLVHTDERTGKFSLLFYQPEKVKTEQLENISLNNIHLQSIEQLDFLLLLLSAGSFGQVVRAKGYCQIAQYWVKFDLVDYQYAITGCEDMPDERAVFIGKNIKYNEIAHFFTQYFTN